MLLWIKVFVREHTRIAVAVAVIVLLALGGGLYYAFAPEKGETFSKSYKLTLSDFDGKPVKLSQYKHQVLVAYAWASWCPYCGAELQNLAKLKTQYGESVQIIAINRAEDAVTARGYVRSLSNVNGIVFLLDPTDSYFKSINGYAMPETVFVAADGKVTYHQRGPLNLADAQRDVQLLMQSGKR